MDSEGRHISNRLRKHRRILGCTHEQMAKKLGLNNAKQYSRWERGIAQPSLRNLLRLGLVFKTLIEELFFEEREIEKEELERLNNVGDNPGDKAVDS